MSDSEWEKVKGDRHGFVECPSRHRNNVDYISNLKSPGLITDGHIVESPYRAGALKGTPPPHFTGPTEIAIVTDELKDLIRENRSSLERERETARDK